MQLVSAPQRQWPRGDADVEAFHLAYHLLTTAISNPANQIEFLIYAGTMQFLRDLSVLHARRTFDGSSGERDLQDTYFDCDDVAALAAGISGEAR